MESITAAQLKLFNNLQRPETDAFGRRNHYHFTVKALPGFPGEAVFIVNPYNQHCESEGRHEIARLSPDQQAKIIVPLLLEAFANRFDEPGPIPQMGSNMNPFVPFTWSTSDEALARAVSARCQILGIRGDLCTVGVSTAKEMQIAETCWRSWSKSLEEAMAMFGYPDDAVENAEKSCEHCNFTPSINKPLFPCNQCEQVWYCSKECEAADSKFHSQECEPEVV
jgi:hypothetical protein